MRWPPAALPGAGMLRWISRTVQAAAPIPGPHGALQLGTMRGNDKAEGILCTPQCPWALFTHVFTTVIAELCYSCRRNRRQTRYNCCWSSKHKQWIHVDNEPERLAEYKTGRCDRNCSSQPSHGPAVVLGQQITPSPTVIIQGWTRSSH